jgi:hypothetical protein
MTQSVFAHGVRAIDCMVDARWKGDAPSGEIPGISYRDNESASYVHPAQHLFASAADRIVEGDTPETLVALMDRLGVERAMLGYNPDKPGRVLECLQRFPTRFCEALCRSPPWHGCIANDRTGCAGSAPDPCARYDADVCSKASQRQGLLSSVR